MRKRLDDAKQKAREESSQRMKLMLQNPASGLSTPTSPSPNKLHEELDTSGKLVYSAGSGSSVVVQESSVADSGRWERGPDGALQLVESPAKRRPSLDSQSSSTRRPSLDSPENISKMAQELENYRRRQKEAEGSTSINSVDNANKMAQELESYRKRQKDGQGSDGQGLDGQGSPSKPPVRATVSEVSEFVASVETTAVTREVVTVSESADFVASLEEDTGEDQRAARRNSSPGGQGEDVKALARQLRSYAEGSPRSLSRPSSASRLTRNAAKRSTVEGASVDVDVEVEATLLSSSSTLERKTPRGESADELSPGLDVWNIQADSDAVMISEDVSDTLLSCEALLSTPRSHLQVKREESDPVNVTLMNQAASVWRHNELSQGFNRWSQYSGDTRLLKGHMRVLNMWMKKPMSTHFYLWLALKRSNALSAEDDDHEFPSEVSDHMVAVANAKGEVVKQRLEVKKKKEEVEQKKNQVDSHKAAVEKQSKTLEKKQKAVTMLPEGKKKEKALMDLKKHEDKLEEKKEALTTSEGHLENLEEALNTHEEKLSRSEAEAEKVAAVKRGPGKRGCANCSIQ